MIKIQRRYMYIQKVVIRIHHIALFGGHSVSSRYNLKFSVNIAYILRTPKSDHQRLLRGTVLKIDARQTFG